MSREDTEVVVWGGFFFSFMKQGAIASASFLREQASVCLFNSNTGAVVVQ